MTSPSQQWPRISFGVIVLNGEPFTRYCLRALYPFAHEIIVVEGANPSSAAIATPEGHSLDGTLETLRRFKVEEDPEDKLQIVTCEGFWSEKDDQSRAYAERATGDYLWQVDIDEFYRPEAIEAVLERLRADPAISAMSFRELKFWGGFDYSVESWHARRGADTYHRLFRWGPNFAYVTHRPPTVLDAAGRNLRDLAYVDAADNARRGIYLHHYSLVFPKQVFEKCEYYRNAPWAQRSEALTWAREVFEGLRRPYRVHNVYDTYGWLVRYDGLHPPQIERLRADLAMGRLGVALRRTDDIEALLRSPCYRLGAAFLGALEPLDRRWGRPARRALRWIRRLVRDPLGSAQALRHRLRRRGRNLL